MKITSFLRGDKSQRIDYVIPYSTNNKKGVVFSITNRVKDNKVSTYCVNSEI